MVNIVSKYANFVIPNKQNIVSFNISEAGLEERGQCSGYTDDCKVCQNLNSEY